jgi:histone H3/H4
MDKPEKKPRGPRGATFSTNPSFRPAFKRLTLKAQVPRLSADAYEELESYSDNLIYEVVRRVIVLISEYNRKTVKPDDVKMALATIGERFLTDSDATLVRCKPVTGKKLSTRMKRYKAQSECRYFAKETFVKMLRAHADTLQAGVRWSAEAINDLILYLEGKLILLISAANQITENAGKTTLQGRDISLVQSTASIMCTAPNAPILKKFTY